jgi:polysaccharide deacetylase family protein (PEP-CTERM system associated)
VHAFTVDVEEWYHPVRFYRDTTRIEERRLYAGLHRLLALLEAHGTRATFFWVAETAAAYPEAIRELAAQGHEIGCHSLKHDRMVYDLSPEQFREETAQALGMLGDLLGRRVTSYRAPCFSITSKSLWALEILAELGITIDSSIFPVRNWRYGMPEWLPGPRVVGRQGQLWEIPLSARTIGGLKIPAVGGAYFRIYPYALTARNFLHLESRGESAVFYIHPWELDPKHPFVPFQWKACATHYFGLRFTEKRLRRLLSEFHFTTLGALIADSVSNNDA